MTHPCPHKAPGTKMSPLYRICAKMHVLILVTLFGPWVKREGLTFHFINQSQTPMQLWSRKPEEWSAGRIGGPKLEDWGSGLAGGTNPKPGKGGQEGSAARTQSRRNPFTSNHAALAPYCTTVISILSKIICRSWRQESRVHDADVHFGPVAWHPPAPRCSHCEVQWVQEAVCAAFWSFYDAPIGPGTWFGHKKHALLKTVYLSSVRFPFQETHKAAEWRCRSLAALRCQMSLFWLLLCFNTNLYHLHTSWFLKQYFCPYAYHVYLWGHKIDCTKH